MSRMEERKKFVGQQASGAGAVLLGQAPTQSQQQQIAQAQSDQHCFMTAQGIFNQVVAHWLTTQERHQQLTHERISHLASQCRAVAPYILAQFGAVHITENLLPSETLEGE